VSEKEKERKKERKNSQWMWHDAPSAVDSKRKKNFPKIHFHSLTVYGKACLDALAF
jgi:hypothetical protein